MRAFNVLLAFVVSLVIGLVVLELGLHVIPAFRPKPTLNQFSDHTGWAKVPGKSITRSIGGEKIHFDINEHGLRDDPGVGPGKAPGTYRVLALGDSFVLGYTVERTDLFVDLLERWWQTEERRIEVVNAGTEGWSTDQEVTWFLENGKAYEPDLVLLFPFENDLYWNGQPAYQSGQEKPLFRPDGQLEGEGQRELAERRASWLSSTATAHFLAVARGWLNEKLGPMLGKKQPGLNPEFGPLLTTPPPGLDDCIARTEGALKQLRDGCKFIGAELLLCPIPSKTAIDPEEREFFRTWKHGLNGMPDDQWSPDRPVNLFLELATKLGIPSLDPRAALTAAAREQGKLYFEKAVEWHFNAQGNRAFATYLHEELERREVFPAAHAARATGALPAPHVAARGGLPTWVFVFAGLWAVLGCTYCVNYPKEPRGKSLLWVGVMLAMVFTVFLGGGWLARQIDPAYSSWVMAAVALVVLGFLGYKLGRRLGTVLELLRSFTLRGHWYLMPLVVVLLTIGSLLVVAASSPLIAPFIYTLF